MDLSLRYIPPKPCMPLSCLLYVPHALPISFLLTPSPEKNWSAVQIMKLLIMKSSPVPRYLVPLRPRLPRHPILENPQPMFLPHRARPSFKFLQNNRQNYRSVYLNAFGRRTGRQKILH